MEYILGRIKDRVAQLFGLLFLSQAIIFIYAAALFSNLPLPRIINSDRSSSQLPYAKEAMAALSLEKLAVEGAGGNEEPGSQKTVIHRVKNKETLGSIWAQYGAPRGGAVLAARAIKMSGSNGLKVGDELELRFSMDGDITDLTKQMTDGRTLVVQGNSVDGYEAAKKPDSSQTG